LAIEYFRTVVAGEGSVMSAKQRARLARQRRKQGVRCYRPAVLFPEFVFELVEAGILTEAETSSDAKVSAAISEILESWRLVSRRARL
jgi:hypothetical protein